MYKFTHINALYQVARYVRTVNKGFDNEQFVVPSPVVYRGSVKLHGTNAGVQCTDDGLVAQSRNRILTLDDDNMDFAKFVHTNVTTEAIREIEAGIRDAAKLDGDTRIVLYGEWCGPGIQNGVALTKLPERQWVLFAVKAVQGDQSRYIDALPTLRGIYESAGVHSVHDVGTWRLQVDFNDKDSMETALAEAEKYAEMVEQLCPWGQRFGIEGMGEGIVWVPIAKHWGNSDLFFKTKGDKHKEVKKAKRNKPSIDPEIVNSVNQFVDFAVTDVRLEKGLDYLREMGKDVDMKFTGDFLKWIGADVKRECEADLEASELEWKQVSKAVNTRALQFFKDKARNL